MKKLRGFEIVKGATEGQVLPLRGTETSAGYDFIATEDIVIRPQERVIFPTNVKAYMMADEMLLLMPRSSTGFTHDLMLLNTLGLIDSDFYENPKNDGNIGIGLRNLKSAFDITGFAIIEGADGKKYTVPTVVDLIEENTVIIKKGEKVVQAVFAKFLESDNCNTDVKRTGGTGSTGK